ncbi:class I SAM-dependent methyltransferase [Thauera chlorobenzoica]|uniref:SAM-dependent methyltransferase n=1 Tax=Thauera chlorobenzoica TaxID=96773 RepID=A0A1H5UM23_9RHOO|nr:SAM-dependent methyltransferase [Thauera chlorobenzoica]APR03549.1 SAM-dependent methyltransferase [Thauera chlorobenzoica]SEF76123.1 Methyltransferase domain-containing protein [Thauera chlorobenzoica]
MTTPPTAPLAAHPEIRPGQSIELLKQLHILTRDGKLNQDSRRKLKQVYHLYQFIEPLLAEALAARPEIELVDHGAGKSYLGFILYDLFFKQHAPAGRIHGIETRDELVMSSRRLADKLGFSARMRFHNLSVADSITSARLPARIDLVTALHACDTATDDAIRFALEKEARFIVLVPCCQAEVAAVLRKHKAQALRHSLAELWRHPLHTREFGSHLTNVLRCLQLEAHGYQVSVTELVGWEHSMKNELIIARRHDQPGRRAAERLAELLATLGLEELETRFFKP